MVNKLNIFAWRKCPTFTFYFINPYTSIKFRYFIICSISTFGLPCMVYSSSFLYLLCNQTNFLFTLTLYFIFCPLAQIHKQYFVHTTTKFSIVMISNVSLSFNAPFARRNPATPSVGFKCESI